jgi:hypothetical protein
MAPVFGNLGRLAVAAGLPLAMLPLAANAQSALQGTGDRWAVVQSDGTLARERGAVSSSMLGRGVYEVTFDSAVRRCVYQATLGNSAAGVPSLGLIGVAPRAGFVKSILVVTRNVGGTPLSAGFHLFVSCPDATRDAIEPHLSASDRWAFVDSDGSILAYGGGSAPQGAALPNLAYEVVFDKDVTKCAYFATAPATVANTIVSVARRNGKPNGVYVRMSPQAARFYLVLKCPSRKSGPIAKNADRWAVMNTDGTLARGVGVLNAEKLNTGNYALSIASNVASASMPVLVTVGNAASGPGLPPAGVAQPFIGSWHGGQLDFQVFTKSPGGTMTDRPFHAYAIRHPAAQLP